MKIKLILLILFFVIILAWSPSKLFPYVLPFVLLTLLLFSFSRSIWFRLVLFLCLFLFWTFLSFLFYPDLLIQNVILSFITYSSFYFALLIPSKTLSAWVSYEKVAKVIMIVILIQSTIGLIQRGYDFSRHRTFDRGSGDVVEGTLHLPLETAGGLAHQSFAANMAFSIVFLLPHIKSKEKLLYLSLILSSMVFLLTNTQHLFIFLFLATVISFILSFSQKKIPKWYLIIIVTMVLIILLAYLLMPYNWGVIFPTYLRQTRDNSKFLMVKRVFSFVDEYPQLLLTGLGPGQGISRASLISTGDYLNISISDFGLEHKFAPLLDEYYFTLYERWAGESSTNQPVSSWLALLSEMGLLGSSLLLLIIIKIILFPNKKAINNDHKHFLLPFRAGCLMLFFMGFQEFYWEYPHAIFLGVFLLKIMHAKLVENNLVNNIDDK